MTSPFHHKSVTIKITATEWSNALAKDVWEDIQRAELFEEMRSYVAPPLMLPRVGLVALVALVEP